MALSYFPSFIQLIPIFTSFSTATRPVLNTVFSERYPFAGNMDDPGTDPAPVGHLFSAVDMPAEDEGLGSRNDSIHVLENALNATTDGSQDRMAQMIFEPATEKETYNVVPAYSENICCKYCHNNLQTKLDLNMHMEHHEKPFVCPVPGCWARFSSKSDLDWHFLHDAIHGSEAGPKSYTCPFAVCKGTQGWARGDGLRLHLQRVHKVSTEDMESKQFRDATATAITDHLFLANQSNSTLPRQGTMLTDTFAEFGWESIIYARTPNPYISANQSNSTLPRQGTMLTDTFTESGYESIIYARTPNPYISTNQSNSTVPRLDAPPTDSGYGSIIDARNLFKPDASSIVITNSTEATQSANIKSMGSPRTKYSESASLQILDEHASLFADELSTALPLFFSRNDWDSIQPALPSILEAFSSKIGYENPGRIQRQLKFLAHRYRL